MEKLSITTQELNTLDEMPDNVRRRGFLEAGEHKIYWEDWGNPEAPPILHLHGGPGGGFNDAHKLLYNPEINRVIFHDQRGSGQSQPFAETKENTTQDLLEDIERLRNLLGIEKAHLSGGSWGSTLALLYALENPDRVQNLMLWSPFLARQSELDFTNEGYPRHTFPEAWERFISKVPKNRRGSGDEIMGFYAEMINSEDSEVAGQYADEWTLWECSLTSIDYNKERLEQEVLGDPSNGAIAKLETHYFLNHCFIAENYILEHIERLKDIPCTLVQGRFDMCTPPSTALDLAEAYGENLHLRLVNAGHLRTDPEMLAALQETAASLLVEEVTP